MCGGNSVLRTSFLKPSRFLQRLYSAIDISPPQQYFVILLLRKASLIDLSEITLFCLHCFCCCGCVFSFQEKSCSRGSKIFCDRANHHSTPWLLFLEHLYSAQPNFILNHSLVPSLLIAGLARLLELRQTRRFHVIARRCRQPCDTTFNSPPHFSHRRLHAERSLKNHAEYG